MSDFSVNLLEMSHRVLPTAVDAADTSTGVVFTAVSRGGHVVLAVVLGVSGGGGVLTVGVRVDAVLPLRSPTTATMVV